MSTAAFQVARCQWRIAVQDAKGEVRARLEGADCVPLALALVQLSGDLSVLGEVGPYVRGPWDYSESIPESMKSRIRDRVASEMVRHGEGRAPALARPDLSMMRRMMSVAVGEEVNSEYVPMVLEQMQLATGESRLVSLPRKRNADAKNGFHAVIVGAGPSGICAAVQLKEMGVPFTLIEKNEEIGGTWLENRYPGCAVDTPNHFYQFSFAPNDEWPEYFSSQQSILDYLRTCVEKYGLLEHIQFGEEVAAAVYDAERQSWRVTTRDGDGNRTEIEGRVLISAVGQLNRPAVPAIPGLDSFSGKALHTAMWPEQGLDLKGKRVILIGSGASAVQVGPAVVDDVAELTVLQRSGAWVARRPNIDRKVSPDKMWALRTIPFYAPWYRFQLFWGFGDGLFDALRIDPEWDGGSVSISERNHALREAMERHIRRELEGREDLLEKVIPDYPPFGKRVLADAGWYRMLRRDHVSVDSTPIEHIDGEAVVLADGTRIKADIIIMATGFQAGRMLWPMEITGRTGSSIRDLWGDNDPRAYLGIMAPEFPNFFIMFGPNTNLGHGGSAIFLAECQMRFIGETIRQMIENGIGSVEIRRDVHDAYNDDIDDKLRSLVWSHPAVTTWYKNKNGRIITNQPWRLIEYWRMTHDPDLSEFVTVPEKALTVA